MSLRTKQEDLIIVGAGAAGLAAAHELSRNGKNVMVLEARNRVGGRIYTVRNPQTIVPIELGAEFVHGMAPQILHIAREGKYTLADVAERHWYLRKDLVMDSGSFFTRVEKIMSKMKRAKRDRSFNEFLESAETRNTEAARVARLYIEGFHAANANRISIQSLNRYNAASDKIGDDHEFRIVEGYDRITQWLYDRALLNGARFQFNSIVREIRWEEHSVVVTASFGKESHEYHAPFALITVPLPILQKAFVRFVPAIPEKQRAADRLAMGHAIKVAFLFRERFWEDLKFPNSNATRCGFDLGFIHAPDQPIPTWWTQLSLRVPLMIGWTGGPNAERLADKDPENIFELALNSLQRILRVPRKNIEGLLEESYFHNWSADVFSGGAYSYVPVGRLSAIRQLAKPFMETLFFAGEATSTEGFTGTVHGAIATGYRAAQEMLRRGIQ